MEIMTETRGEKLIVNEQGEVVGVEATQSTGTSVLIHAEAVILASGGYDRNPELKKEYSPTYADSITNVGAGNEGDGLLMAREIGAQIVGNDSAIAQILPFGAAMQDLFTCLLYTSGNFLIEGRVREAMMVALAAVLAALAAAWIQKRRADRGSESGK